MITRAFTKESEVRKFRNKYANAEVRTEVISNPVQPYNRDKYPAISDYCDFLMNRKSHVLQMYVSFLEPQALKWRFGKHDFKYTGNRTYTNYVLQFEDLQFVAGGKREVVIPKGQTIEELLPALVRFEKAYQQLIMDSTLENLDKLDITDLGTIDTLRDLGILRGTTLYYDLSNNPTTSDSPMASY